MPSDKLSKTSLRDRPSLSSRHTTRVFPARRCENANCRFGRSAAPSAVSSKIRSHPASLTRCHFPNDRAATKLVYLALRLKLG